MNNKGQFTIISALFVAVILIATVIITYSSIRNSPVQEQSQILNAVDETILALKQTLGFTVGYYGSVLQVTGNNTFAEILAKEYFQSGLDYISNMHPEWGASFNVTSLTMKAYWFTNSSYSMGSLAVNYSLTGLGIYGLTYQTSCKLTVQIGKTTDNVAQITVKKDNDEPLINLGKSNFKFYRYIYENSTWKQVSPVEDTSVSAYSDGTYLINMSDTELYQKLDPYSYVVQVVDQRGIMVVAASFNNYVCEMIWNQSSFTRYALSGNATEILGAPDGIYKNVRKDQTYAVTGYQNAVGIIKQVYFNITYYGSASGTLEWYYRLDGGSWVKIENLPQGGSATSPLTRSYNATGLRTQWTLEDLNNTHIGFKNNFNNDNNDGAFVDAIYLTIVFDVGGNYSTIQDATFVVELMQNGTLRWLGQELQITTTAKPFPPIPVKSIRVNQTINGVNQEVPFQIEDWASDYTVPLGLTNNATVFSSRNMLAFLVNSTVSKVTIWWDGNDNATPTQWSYVNRYFRDNPSSGTLNNGILTLTIDASGNSFIVKSKVGTTEITANFMRINSEWSVYGSDPAYTIYNGTVRDIIHAEAEWSSGVDNCPNVYSHIVITLPAKATYYTYQLRLMFIDSRQDRNITDLCPIRLTIPTGSPQTENGTQQGYPIISTETGIFYNYSASFSAHHWSQFTSGTKGGGIMFTDTANAMLYFFDNIAGNATGAIKVTNSTNRIIELLPITRVPVSFTNALDVTWYGAVVTFDNTKPIYQEVGGVKTGLWITAEYPPIATITTEI